MQNPRLALRYAKSLVDLSLETGKLEDVHQDILLLQSVMKNNRELLIMLRSPVVPSKSKEKVFSSILDGRVDPITAMFCQLLIRKGREAFLPEIAEALILLYRSIKQISNVKISTAVAIDPALQQAILNSIRSHTPLQDIALETRVDSRLIGGFVLETGDILVDASIRRDLDEIKTQFLENTYLQKLK
ncbi:MAG TPA: ATP synthase F1 subunit delta [Chitinophagaceae bacterium]|nr:ATP synthase F1 subunit delta [Chitinophagaceae bacterium]